MSELFVLDLSFTHEGVTNGVNPVVLKDDKNMILVDAGFAGFLSLLEEQFEKNGLSMSDLTKLILTSHEIDHIGMVAELTQKYPQIEVISSYKEAPYLNREKTPLLINHLNLHPEAMPHQDLITFEKMVMDIPSIIPDALQNNYDYLHDCGGIEFLVHENVTMLYFEEFEALYAADVFSIDKKGVLTSDIINYKMSDVALTSIIQMLKADYTIDKLLCYHGGSYEKDIMEALNAINPNIKSVLTPEMIDLADLEKILEEERAAGHKVTMLGIQSADDSTMPSITEAELVSIDPEDSEEE